MVRAAARVSPEIPTFIHAGSVVMKEQLVIVIGVYPEFVRRLGGALVDAGFTVRPTTNCGDAEKALLSGKVAAVVTSPYLAASDRKRLATAARRGHAKVIMLHQGELKQTELADAVITASPENVVEALREMVPSSRRHTA